MARLDDYLRDLEQRVLPKWRARLKLLESGKAYSGDGPWDDLTEVEVRFLKRTIAQYETIAAEIHVASMSARFGLTKQPHLRSPRAVARRNFLKLIEVHARIKLGATQFSWLRRRIYFLRIAHRGRQSLQRCPEDRQPSASRFGD
ncbi:hypothetical protein [Methylocella sp.]|uniref:hypothetical protein n=1 Tax=Methylocella sp. TaxID=1978226 RepID=UPI003C1E2B29